uniref:Uncharacterized protein n=1 Tax=Ananas comosus var. bracteatus TaxID=296719 RepID=A0A6V7PY76_ANACO|nr:unnamed protein product [Ananas comosus var. bracteatus]
MSTHHPLRAARPPTSSPAARPLYVAASPTVRSPISAAWSATRPLLADPCAAERKPDRIGGGRNSPDEILTAVTSSGADTKMWVTEVPHMHCQCLDRLVVGLDAETIVADSRAATRGFSRTRRTSSSPSSTPGTPSASTMNRLRDREEASCRAGCIQFMYWRPYLVSSDFIDHPLFCVLIERSGGGEGTSSATVVGCEVVLFK